MAPRASRYARQGEDSNPYRPNGNPGDVAPVGEGVSEMRIHYGPGYRIYFVAEKDRVVILLCGGDKSTQAADVRKAKELATTLE